MKIELSDVLRNRRWWRFNMPFPYFWADDLFQGFLCADLEHALREKLSQGLSDRVDLRRFSRNMPYSDAFSWDIPREEDGPLSIFTSRKWHDLICELTGVKGTGDVNCALHHHPIGSTNGAIHQDLGIGWFSDQPKADGINVMDLQSCSYTTGRTARPDVRIKEVVRAATMIFYFGNSNWRCGDGGETGLYESVNQAIDAPHRAIPPINNSVLVFENTPWSFHSFVSNRVNPRNSLILWVHRDLEEARVRWGDHSIFRW